MTVALILAAHGSHISPNTAGLVWGYVDELRRRGVADEITACFWKEQPHFHQALNMVSSDTVVIVPMFTAVGFFSQQVIPVEIGLRGDITKIGNRTIYYTKTLGQHPLLDDVVQKRVTDAIEQFGLSKDESAVAIIGHGTKRSATTRKTTKHQVKNITELGVVAQAIDAYLDDDPDIFTLYERTSEPNLVVVPFFLAPGSHATQDVPEALGIKYGEYPAQVNGRTVYYTPPIGTDDVIVELIIALIEGEIGRRDTIDHAATSTWSHFPQVGRSDLISAIQKQPGSLIYGQLRLSRDCVEPINSTGEVKLGDVPALRRHIREEPFRSLTTSDDLPFDWMVPIENVAQIPAVVETVYPATLADWAANRHGEFDAETFEDIIKRQQGMFQSLASIDKANIAHHVTSVCGRCIKHPTWHENRTPSDTIPCPAPCNHFLSQLKEADNDDR